MHRWTSIEVFDSPTARASQWAETFGDLFMETAFRCGALDWEMKPTAWGMVFEVEFKTDAEWDHFKNLPIIEEALKSTPNPRDGVLVYRGRSLDGGSTAPRKPKPRIGSGAAALELPVLYSIPFEEALPALFSDSNRDTRRLTHI